MNRQKKSWRRRVGSNKRISVRGVIRVFNPGNFTKIPAGFQRKHAFSQITPERTRQIILLKIQNNKQDFDAAYSKTTKYNINKT